MSVLAYVAMFGWIPAVLLLFHYLPPRRAVVAGFVAAWLFLPLTRFDLPGLPDYTKMSATTVGVLLASVLCDSGRLAGFKPCWFDLPMVAWCLVPLASSLTNGLGVYDGLSSVLSQVVTWGLPYLIGRLYFADRDGLWQLAIGIVIGGLVYVPLCLFEIRMSPQLNRMIYGFGSQWVTAVRYGGYRPAVFLSNGLELGMWMTAACLVGYWLWASGAAKPVWGIPFGMLLVALLVVTFLCKSTGSLILLAVGMAVLWTAARTRSSLSVWILVLAPVLYMGTRATNLWSGADAVELARTWVDEERAASFECRLRNEDILAAKALQRPILGWGGWGRSRVYDEEGRDISITDGQWIITLGCNGLVGLVSQNLAILMPIALLWWRHPARSWRDPGVAPAAALAVLIGLFVVDNLSNAMFNPIYVLAAGGVMAFAAQRPGIDEGQDPQVAPRDAAWDDADRARAVGRVEGQAIGPDPDDEDLDPRPGLALEYGARARSLKDHGYFDEAEAAWTRAVHLWADLASDFPGYPEYRKRWLDSQNDLAWFLANDSDPRARDPTRAVHLAEQCVSVEPGCGLYWNTLGAAHYRAASWDAAIAALERSVELGQGNGFDFLFLAMASWQKDDPAGAKVWSRRADEWIDQHPSATLELLPYRRESVALMERSQAPHPALES